MNVNTSSSLHSSPARWRYYDDLAVPATARLHCLQLTNLVHCCDTWERQCKTTSLSTVCFINCARCGGKSSSFIVVILGIIKINTILLFLPNLSPQNWNDVENRPSVYNFCYFTWPYNLRFAFTETLQLPSSRTTFLSSASPCIPFQFPRSLASTPPKNLDKTLHKQILVLRFCVLHYEFTELIVICTPLFCVAH